MANWFSNKVNMAEFCNYLGEDVTFRSRIFNVIAHNVPINLNSNNNGHREKINEANNLEEDTIKTIRWAKPSNRRTPQQRSTHLILLFTDLESANRTITNSITICNKKFHVEE